MNVLRGKRAFPKIIMVIVALMMLIPSAAFADSTTDGIEQNYKATGNLTDADKNDENQKNYQKADGSNADTYLYKSAEWTDKAAGKAKITLTAKVPVEKAETTAVYAYTTCTFHGFTRAIAKKNIEFLLENYDHVDVIECFEKPIIHKDVKTAEEAIVYSDFGTNRHHSFLIYKGLYDYLMGVTPGSETGTETQKMQPTCIYTSFDTHCGDEIINKYEEGYAYDCWNILKKYRQEGRYFSMGQSYKGKTQFLSIYINYNPSIGVLNALAGLMDPTIFPGINSETLWDGTTNFKANSLDPAAAKELYAEDSVYLRTNVEADYGYKDTFEALGVPVVNNLQMVDSVSDMFDITKVTSSQDSVVVKTSGNTVLASMDEYDRTENVIVTVDVQLKDINDQANDNKWLDTNTGKARLSLASSPTGNTTILDVSSPKLCYNLIEKYKITTEVVNGKIDESILDIKEGDSKTINYTPDDGYELKSVTVDGDPVDIATYPTKYDFNNINANHAIKVVYEPKAVAVEKYKITTEVVNGKIDKSILDIKEGDSKTIEYSPAEGYELKSVTVDNNPVDIATYPDNYKFENINANHNIKVVYEKKAETQEGKYTISTEVVNGSIDPSITNIAKNDSKTIEYSPAEGFELKSVTVDGDPVDIATYPTKYDFKDIVANHAIRVVYEPKAVAVEKYTITTKVVNGSIDPSITSIAKNDNKTIEYSPAEGFKLMSVTVDGDPVDIATYPEKYDFKDIAANHAIKVVYEKMAADKEEPTNPGSDPGSNDPANPAEDTDNSVETGEDTGMLLLSILIGTMAAMAATAVAVRRKTTK